MKLDPRIILLTDIITCFDEDVPRAKKYVGQIGYFSDDMMEFNDLESCVYGELKDYSIYDHYPFRCSTDDIDHAFFIPESVLKPKEKQYRAFTIDEFMREFTIGNIVTFRHKTNRNSEYRAIYNGYHINSEGEFMAYLGIWKYSLEELFDYYELLNSATAKWQPFGVEVEE